MQLLQNESLCIFADKYQCQCAWPVLVLNTQIISVKKIITKFYETWNSDLNTIFFFFFRKHGKSATLSFPRYRGLFDYPSCHCYSVRTVYLRILEKEKGPIPGTNLSFRKCRLFASTGDFYRNHQPKVLRRVQEQRAYGWR